MCRLFAINATPERIRATFWLLNASDSFVSQSRSNPDGTGLGYFDENNVPVVDKEPLAAFDDRAFLREAKQVSSTVVISHVRFATAGKKTPENCHPFEMDARLFAHNGAIGGLERLDAKLGSDVALVKGQTDSERLFALITKEIRARDGDVTGGITAAVRWIAENIPVCSINFVLGTPHDLWAFRYPETDTLFVLQRPPGGHGGDREAHYISQHLRVHSPQLRERPAVVVASERMDDNPDWRIVRSGELLHVAGGEMVTSKILIDQPPAQTYMPSASTGGQSTESHAAAP
jgi:predicted glutamine amidotransferase